MVTCVTKTRRNEVKQHNLSRTRPAGVVDANLIAFRASNGADTAKYVDPMASVFYTNSVGALVRANHPT